MHNTDPGILLVSTSTDEGDWTTTTTAGAAASTPDSDDDDGYDDEPLHPTGPGSTLFWFLVIGVPILGSLAFGLLGFAFIYRSSQKKEIRRRRQRRARRRKVVVASEGS